MKLQNASVTKERLAGVLYCSQATDEMSSAQLRKIIKTSQVNNSRRGITGLLVYGGGMFMQWLEGPRYEVRKLAASIALDSRHEAIVYLHKMVDLDSRLYRSSAMQNVAPDACRDHFSDCLSLIRDRNDRQLVLQMIALLETRECEAGRPKFAVKPAASASLSVTDSNSMLKDWLVGSLKGLVEKRLLSFL